jgi:hypothetical protein
MYTYLCYADINIRIWLLFLGELRWTEFFKLVESLT